MNTHKKIQELLYEYLRNELGETERAKVEQHVASCARCKAEMENLQDTLQMIPSSALDASKGRTEEYWRNFSLSVERKINDPKPLKKRQLLSVGDMIEHMFFTPRPYITAFGGALAVLVCAILVWSLFEHKEATNRELADNATEQLALPDSTNQRVYQYVKQTKMVLVGISNMKPISGATYDVSVEQAKSRKLIHEARYLENQPLDERTAKLIDDLQKILIELANMKAQGNAPNVDIIRGGVHEENLLFKIRMAEDTYNPKRENKTSF
jgi:hypothetical protein